MAYYDTVIAADSPAAWWPLTDANGAGTLVDSSGGGNAATNHGLVMGQAQTPVAGDTTALGGSGYASSAYVPNGLTASSAEAWTYATSAPAVQYALSSGISSGNNGIGIYFTVATANARFGNGVTDVVASHATALVQNTWQYWAYTWDGAHITSYLNGAQLGAPVVLTGTSVAGGTTYVGSQSTVTNELQGNLAQVAVYSYALTAAKIAAHYQAAINPPSGGLPVASGSGGGQSPYWATRVAEQHFAHRARVQGTLGRGNQ